MEVILTKDVEKLGKAGDVIKVKNGYAKNFLIPKGLAAGADRRNTKFLENEQKKLQARHKKLKEKAEALKDKLQTLSCTIAMTAGEGDKLYGEVTPEMISNFYEQEGIDIDKRRIHFDKPIRHVGVYQVDIKLHQDITTNVKVWVVKK